MLKKLNAPLVVAATVALLGFAASCGDDTNTPTTDGGVADSLPPCTISVEGCKHDGLVADTKPTPDSGPADPCADWYWLKREWSCDAAPNYTCTPEVKEENKICTVRCTGHFYLPATSLSVSKSPPKFAYGSGPITCSPTDK